MGKWEANFIESASDTIARTDTVRVRFIQAMGSLENRIDSSSALHASQFIWTDAKYLGDLFWKQPGFYLRDFGEFGQPNQLNAFGADWRNIAILLDGRPLNDPITNTFSLYDFPLEAVEQIEVVSGAHGFLFGSNAAGATINLVTRQYNDVRPLSKIRYVQGPFEYGLTDGLFAQNVARGTNLMLGFQRHVTNGRFTNSKYDSWHWRARLRYNYSDRLNISVSDFYSKSTIGMNGGIDFLKSPSLYDEITALVRSGDASQTVLRNDVTLHAIGRLLPDSISTTQVSLYYTSFEREYHDQNLGPGNPDLHAASFRGVRLLQSLDNKIFPITFGGEIEQRHVEKSRTIGTRSETLSSLFGKTEWKLLSFFTPSAYARTEKLDTESSLSYGLDATLKLGSEFSITAAYSRSYRHPTMQERYWTDSTFFSNADIRKELHEFSQIALHAASRPDIDFSLSFFQRRISDAIVFQPIQTPNVYPSIKVTNVPTINVVGSTVSLTLRAGGFEFFTNVLWMEFKEVDTVKLPFPAWTVMGEASYRDTYFHNALDARIGLRFQFMSRNESMQFVPQTLTYLPSIQTILGSFLTIDLFAIMQLGDAYITLVWENPLNVNHIITPVYPMPSRNFKLGVNWVFID